MCTSVLKPVKSTKLVKLFVSNISCSDGLAAPSPTTTIFDIPAALAFFIKSNIPVIFASSNRLTKIHLPSLLASSLGEGENSLKSIVFGETYIGLSPKCGVTRSFTSSDTAIIKLDDGIIIEKNINS